jgi:ArsR family transcriptional regulator
MNAATRKRLEAQAAIVKAMAHPTRLFIVEQLAQEERCVQELTDMVGVDVSTMSKHLAVLKREGILDDEKRGQQVYYRLAMPCVLNFFTCVRTVIESRGTTTAKT